MKPCMYIKKTQKNYNANKKKKIVKQLCTNVQSKYHKHKIFKSHNDAQ